MTLTVGSLFSGAGGFDVGLEQAGFTIVWQVEKDAHARKVLAKHWPGIKQYDDVCEFHGWAGSEGGKYCVQRGSSANAQGRGERDQPGSVRLDLLVGGWPCQDLSVAGKRAGLAGERSGLFFEVLRIAKETKPTWGLFENVPGLLSSHGGRDMATVLEGLRQCWPVVGYRVLDSQYFGVAQRRKRVFFVCGPTERSVEAVLFEPEGSSGHLAASHETRKELATDIAASLRGSGGQPRGFMMDAEAGLAVVDSLTARDSKGYDRGDNSHNSKLVVSPITGNGCYGDQIGNEPHLTVGAFTNLGLGGPDDNEAQAGNLIAHTLRGEGFDGSEDGTGRGTPIVAVSANQRGEIRTRAVHGSLMGTKSGKQFDGILHNGVRRLTPTETERLQGFTDGWTCLCQPLATYDHMVCRCADGPRYRMMGNAVTVNVIKWLGERIKREIEVGGGES